MRSSKLLILAACCASHIALVPLTESLAHAADASSEVSERGARVSELNEAGAKYYSARSYRRAIEKFIEAYAIDRDPNLLFNIARCYEELGETAAAIEKYRAFLASPGADAEGRLRARQSLSALERLKNDQAAESAGTGEPPEQDVEAPSIDTAGEGRKLDAPAPWKGFLPWAVLGAGVVTTGVGAAFYALGARDHARVTDAPGYADPSRVHAMTEREAAALARSGDTKKLAGGICLGVGGALLATSVVLLVTFGSSPSGGETALGVTVDPRSRRLAVGVTGRF